MPGRPKVRQPAVAALGAYQVERLAWKPALIDALAARVQALAFPAAEACRHGSVARTPVVRDTLVQAASAGGGGGSGLAALCGTGLARVGPDRAGPLADA